MMKQRVAEDGREWPKMAESGRRWRESVEETLTGAQNLLEGLGLIDFYDIIAKA
jgi:hypothetical protein